MNKGQKDAYDKAQVMLHFAAGGKVEAQDISNQWRIFEDRPPSWNWRDATYRIAKPTPKKVKLLAWFTGTSLVRITSDCMPVPSWKRIPSKDEEIEVEE